MAPHKGQDRDAAKQEQIARRLWRRSGIAERNVVNLKPYLTTGRRIAKEGHGCYAREPG